jgi:hypothetical protein
MSPPARSVQQIHEAGVHRLGPRVLWRSAAAQWHPPAHDDEREQALIQNAAQLDSVAESVCEEWMPLQDEHRWFLVCNTCVDSHALIATLNPHCITHQWWQAQPDKVAPTWSCVLAAQGHHPLIKRVTQCTTTGLQPVRRKC